MTSSANPVSTAASGRRIMPIRTPGEVEKSSQVTDPRSSERNALDQNARDRSSIDRRFMALGGAVKALPGWSRRLRFVVGLATVGVAGARGAGSGGAARHTFGASADVGTGHAARGRVIRLNRVVQER